MAGGPVRKVVAGVVVGVVVGAVLKALRGDPAPQFSNHPTVDGGPGRAAPVIKPASRTGPPADADPGAIVEATLFPVAEVAADEDPAPAIDLAAAEPVADTPVADTPVADAPTDAPGAETIVTDAPGAETIADAPAGGSAEVTTGSSTDTGAPDVAWVEPVDGGCPPGYLVKAKLKSGIFHLPGMFAYERTNPDRCYASAEAAEADGLRPAKR
jgi:hypothetical protein